MASYSLKDTNGTLIFSELLLLFLLPFLPDSVLMYADNYSIRAVLLALIVLSAIEGPFVLLLTFIVVLSIFVLRNHRKMRLVQQPNVKLAREFPAAIREFPEVDIPALKQPAFEEPSGDMYTWEPSEDTGSNEFVPVGPSINEKVVLPTEEVDGNGGGVFMELNRQLLS
jgi:hypothetical protein